jgi:HPt (histidine-containing phosphotransfer) domain-containing protein
LSKPFSLSEIETAIELHMSNSSPSPLKNKLEEPEKSSISLENDTEINMRAIRNILEVEKQTGRRLLPELYDGYLKQMTEKLDELSGENITSSKTELRKLAHAMKSMSANMGAEGVVIACARLEKAAQTSDQEEIDECTKAVNSAYLSFSQSFSPADYI